MHPPIPHAVHQARPPATHPHGAPKPARSRLTPRRLRVAAFACLAVAASAPTSFARSTPLVIRVDAGALAPTPDGLSWSTAYNSLDDALLAARAALDAASPPARVELWLTAGLYRPTLDADLQPTPGRDATFSLIDDLHILGGFTGSELTPDQRPNDPPDTILSGELGDNATIDDTAFNVVTFIAPPAADLAEALLDTLTIRDGNAIGQPDGANPLAGEGAAVATRFSDLTLRRVALLSNRAHTGGAVSTRNGVLTVERSDFLDNRAQGDAGALNSQSQLLVRDSTFASNDARFGGAILACCRTVRIERTDFFGNTATWGGAIYTPSGTLELLAVNGYDNTASRGGFLNNAADAHAANLRLGSNTAANGGAVYNAASLTIDNGEFTRNLAFENGGALNSASGQLTLCNATLLANRSFIQGGAVYLGFGSATLTNAVVADNQDGFGDDAPAQLAASALATLDAQTVLIDAPLAGLPITDPIIAAPLFADRLGPDGILGTSELQSQIDLVCRLLPEKKMKKP